MCIKYRMWVGMWEALGHPCVPLWGYDIRDGPSYVYPKRPTTPSVGKKHEHPSSLEFFGTKLTTQNTMGMPSEF